jgi:hypothetical protein
MTNPKIGMTGMFEISDRVICFDTGITDKELKNAKQELREKVRFCNEWVYLVNSERYNCYRGGKLKIAYNKELAEIPKDIKNTLLNDKQDRVSENNDRVSDLDDTPNKIKYNIINNNNTSTCTSTQEKEINKEKEVKEKKYSKVTDITQEDLEDLAKEYSLKLEYVEDVFRRMQDWCLAKGKPYANYKSGLRTWLNNSLDKGGFRGKQGFSVMPGSS